MWVRDTKMFFQKIKFKDHVLYVIRKQHFYSFINRMFRLGNNNFFLKTIFHAWN